MDSTKRKRNQLAYDEVAVERALCNNDQISWWYLSGLADARGGYGHAGNRRGTVYYRGQQDDCQIAYDLGYTDGIN